MARKHELEIEIDAMGQVHVKVVGAKGKSCMQYVELFAKVGQVTEQRPTGEYYEPGADVGIVDRTHTGLKF